MMTQINRKSKFGIIIMILIIALFFSCTKDEPTNPNDEKQPPTPPQPEYFIIDLNAFPDTTSPAPFNKGQGTLTRENWRWAYGNVVVWNSLLTLTLISPVAAFNTTIQVEPELQPDGRWLWSKNYMIGGVSHTTKLYGETANGGVEWEMYLSKEGAFADFLWFDGFSNLPLTEGDWTLYKDPPTGVEFLDIVWHRNPQQGSADIKYTNIIPGHQENGGYIYFEKTSSSPFDRFYDIYNKGANNLTEIEWDSISKEGRVLDAMHFSNGDWHCWDSILMDITCP